MNSGSEHDLKRRLKAVGLSDSAIDAAWPQWWSDAAEGSPSASLELRFSIARKLGLDARSLLDEEDTPRFVWRDEARFKNLSGESELEQAAISSFGRAVGSILLGATGAAQIVLGADASSVRDSVLSSRPFVGLLDLLVLCWTAGIPVIHLRVFPWPQKRMAAMTVRVGNRSAILLGKDSMYTRVERSSNCRHKSLLRKAFRPDGNQAQVLRNGVNLERSNNHMSETSTLTSCTGEITRAELAQVVLVGPRSDTGVRIASTRRVLYDLLTNGDSKVRRWIRRRGCDQSLGIKRSSTGRPQPMEVSDGSQRNHNQ